MSAATWKPQHDGIRHRTGRSSGPGSCFTPPRAWATTRSPPGSTLPARWSPSGASGSATSGWQVLATCNGEGGPRPFPPEVVVAVKALACELPAATGTPLARWHCPDLDLYARIFDGQPLAEDDYVLSADEKTSIQARIRRHASLPAAPGRPPRTEFEYTRGGALQYLAAWDVHR